MSNKGFTLIELLVVIAIIGILASIVLVTFPGAQNKAKDSRMVGAVAQMRTVMTYIGSNTGSYVTFACATVANPCVCADADLIPLCTEVFKNKSGFAAGDFVMRGGAGSYDACMYANLNGTGGQGKYCADATGKAGYVDEVVDPGAVGFCDGTTYICPAVTG